jgi:ferredoxin
VNKTLLKQLEAEGVEIPAACYTGICWACICEIEKGEDNINKNFRGEPGFPMGDEEVMTCIAGVKADENDEVILKMMY